MSKKSWFEMGNRAVEILEKHFAGKELVADSVENLAERVVNEAKRLLEEIGCRVTGKDYDHDYGLIRLYVCCREACTSVDEIIIDIRGDVEVKMKVREVDVL
jgi:predicted metal-dependent hydrolase